MIQGAMNAYKMFSGGESNSGGGGGGGFLDNISMNDLCFWRTWYTIIVILGSTYQNAQKMYAIYKQFDKNGDGKITSEDIQIYFQELGLGFVSPC